MMNPRFAGRFLAAIFAAALTHGAPCQAAEPSLGQADRQQVVDDLCTQLSEGYVYPETAAEMVSDLRRRHEAGYYEHFTARAALASQLTHDLQAISHDKHLRISFGKLRRAGSAPRRMVRRVVPQGENPAPGQRRVAVPSQRTNGSPLEGKPLFGKVEVLDGNIGYLEVHHFNAGAESAEAIDEAMASLRGVDALVIDVGRNPGGSTYVIRHLSAYLFAEPTHLASTFGRGWAQPEERWTLDHVAGERLTEIPVYVLTSGFTFSAAESFTFGLKINDRITQVGERTGGGGHWGREVELRHGYRMFLPEGRTYDPETGKGWEAAGLEPDVKVPYPKALESALEAAKKAIAASGSGA